MSPTLYIASSLWSSSIPPERSWPPDSQRNHDLSLFLPLHPRAAVWAKRPLAHCGHAYCKRRKRRRDGARRSWFDPGRRGTGRCRWGFAAVQTKQQPEGWGPKSENHHRICKWNRKAAFESACKLALIWPSPGKITLSCVSRPFNFYAFFAR